MRYEYMLYIFVILLFAGTSYERSRTALTEMGPAILNGGVTTFLALVLLSLSSTYTYVVFFKVSA
jgi:Niemann-Pick C1 protein